jgi:hypothetical protein
MNTQIVLFFQESSKGEKELLFRRTLNSTNFTLMRKVKAEFIEIARNHVSFCELQHGTYSIIDVGMNFPATNSNRRVWKADVREFIPGWKRIVVNGRKRWHFESPKQLTLNG